MKWTHCLIILLVASGCFAELDSDEESEENFEMDSQQACLKREHEECFEEHVMKPREVPKTAEELLSMCRMATQIGRCMIRVNCSRKQAETDFMRKTMDYIDTTCQEENPLFQEISSHLGCITETLHSSNLVERVCRPHLYRDMDLYYDFTGPVASFAEKSLFLNEDNMECVDALFYNACPSILVGIHCGNKTRAAVYEVLNHVDNYGERWCGEVIMTSLIPLIDVFEELIIEKINSENEIDEK